MSGGQSAALTRCKGLMEAYRAGAFDRPALVRKLCRYWARLSGTEQDAVLRYGQALASKAREKARQRDARGKRERAVLADPRRDAEHG